LSRATANADLKRLKVRAELPESLEVADLTASSLRPNCVVAVNLFEATADPMALDAIHTRAALRIAGFEGARLFAVLGVTAVDRSERSTPSSIPSMLRLGVERLDPKAPFTYNVERDSAGDGDVMVLTSMSATIVPNRWVVSARVLATNGNAASMLPPGSVSVMGNGMEDVVELRNLVATSWSGNSPVGMDRIVRVEAFAQLPGAFSPAEALRNLLLAILPSRGVPKNALRTARRRIAPIEQLDVEAYVRSDDGTSTRGYLVRTSIDESAFEGRGEVELFARLLQAVLRRTVPLGAPVRVEAHLRIAHERLVIE